MIEASIDYLRVVWPDVKDAKLAIDLLFPDRDCEKSVPLYGYRTAIKHKHTGAVLLSNGHSANMGTCMQLGGKAIDAIEQASGWLIVDMLAGVIGDNARITRLDIALDFRDGALSVYDARELIRYQQYVSTYRAISVVEGARGEQGMTVYIGNAESSTRLRIYDKSAETGEGHGWTRWEAVLTNERAVAAWHAIAVKSSNSERSEVAKAVVLSVVDFPDWEAFQDFRNGADAFEWDEVGRPDSDTWKWLLKSVAPTFVRARDATGDWSLLEQFVDAVVNGDLDR